MKYRRLAACAAGLLLSTILYVEPAHAATGIRISGGRLVEANGTELVLRGINHAHTWYPQRTASFADISYQPGDVLMFGPEPTGLDEVTLADPHITSRVRIPMLAGRRSLNLSNAAAVAVYEAWRQHGFNGAV